MPQVDPFSYTRLGQTWQYPGWLVEVPMAWIYQIFGPGGLNLWTALMVTLSFTFVWRTMSGGVFLRAFVLVLAAATSGVYWAARPYLVTFFLTAVYFWILESHRWRGDDLQPDNYARTMQRLWWLPVLMVAWVNSHGGFAVGFILWGVYWLDAILRWAFEVVSNQRPAVSRETIDGGRRTTNDPTSRHLLSTAYTSLPTVYRLTLVGVLMIVAVCLNPSGPVMLAYPLKTVSIGALQEYIQEWQSPDFHQRAAQPFIWLLVFTFSRWVFHGGGWR